MIASMIDCVRMARKRAYRARGEGNHTQASEAFYDAYTYVEMIRDLKERL